MATLTHEKATPQVQGAPNNQGPPAYQPQAHEMATMNPNVVPGTQQYVTPLGQLQDVPAAIDCPACGRRAITKTEFKSGNTTNAWALGLCLFTLCCCIPYMIKSTKNVVHKCGNCGTKIATWHRSGRTVVYV